MKRLTTLFLVLLLAGQAWGADLHVKELAESAPNYVQYRASATGCDDAGEWTASAIACNLWGCSEPATLDFSVVPAGKSGNLRIIKH